LHSYVLALSVCTRLVGTEARKDNLSGETLSDIPIIMITHLLERTRLDGGRGHRRGDRPRDGPWIPSSARRKHFI